MTQHSSNRTQKQSMLPNKNTQGVALVMGLLILLVMTIIGAAAMESSSLEERMAGNALDINVAFQAAEAALDDAENYSKTTLKMAHFSALGQSGLYPEQNAGTLIWETIDWEAVGSTRNASSTISGVHENPTYILEYLQQIVYEDPINQGGYDEQATLGPHIIRITSRGKGASENSSVLLQSTYGIEPNKF